MHVLMVAACPFPANRGTPARILRVSEALARTGHRIDVLTYFNSDFPLRREQIRIFRARRIPFCNDNTPGPKLYKLLADPLLLGVGVRVCRQNQYDVIHGHHVEGGLCAMLLGKRFRVPFVYDSHTILEREISAYGVYGSFPIKRSLTMLEAICYKNSDASIYVDGEILSYAMEHGVAPEIGEVVPSGTNVTEIGEIAEHLQNPFDSRPSTRKVVYTGSISRYQNVDDIVRVAAKIDDPEIRFFIVTGDSAANASYLEKLIAELRLKDRVSLLFDKTFTEQLAYIGFSDVALSPRDDCSGQPQKITNYMALGKKIVCSSGSAKVLNDSSAYIYEKGNIEDFGRKLIQAVNDHSGARETEARRAVQSLDWDRLSLQVDKVYQRAVSQFRSRPR
jgi:glycosyltransferase involved in cell wall biosynthesis